MIFLKKLHKWVGLLIGIQVMLWLISGLVISLLDPAKVSGAKWKHPATKTAALEFEQLQELETLAVELTTGALGIDLKVIRDQPVFQITKKDGVSLVDARTGLAIRTTEQEAGKLAQQDFAGDGDIVSIESGMAPDLETRKHSGPYWRVNFSDAASTSYYLSESTGKILERRNSYWRNRDFFWMLHIMDYSGREDFNNALIILVALTAIWLGLSGFLLLFYSFNRHDFWFLSIAARRDKAVITLIDPAIPGSQTVRLRKGSNLFLALAARDINLPSVCGGGGECGKCRLVIEGPDLPQANKIERGLIPGRRREQGFRLACQIKTQSNITLHLPAGTLASGSGTISSPA